jgi:hypothetical protein
MADKSGERGSLSGAAWFGIVVSVLLGLVGLVLIFQGRALAGIYLAVIGAGSVWLYAGLSARRHSAKVVLRRGDKMLTIARRIWYLYVVVAAGVFLIWDGVHEHRDRLVLEGVAVAVLGLVIIALFFAVFHVSRRSRSRICDRDD